MHEAFYRQCAGHVEPDSGKTVAAREYASSRRAWRTHYRVITLAVGRASRSKPGGAIVEGHMEGSCNRRRNALRRRKGRSTIDSRCPCCRSWYASGDWLGRNSRTGHSWNLHSTRPSRYEYVHRDKGLEQVNDQGTTTFTSRGRELVLDGEGHNTLHA